ncbi:hypothetical protein QQS21_007059 [Conoideocrella luteorostrata]|uniref:Uncharacterized protein n=1 Tax=Conoideocrella luteorostrata TaxID=1105319 RepID=A0AAJ0CQS7_9HYPO|nr:hypothetical protein QQS21_007059 [Conoideocrella luteorostrata]
MKFLPVAVLFFALEVCASKISYSTGYKKGGIKNQGGIENKAGGTIPDNKDDDVLKKMGEWSSNEFKAKRNERSKVIIVSRVEKVENKGDAADANNKAQQIVNKHVK